ncbi:winged helix-turn-helix domain-containing protein [Vibrio cincinnatiensis]|uniref:winged helix-turn-helix domain-containing protein n=1 Tax=Vibrio cincinnatiensis TaxID=675 RepID=UPI001EE14E04|nr:transcriptional regulator [Vibrio cincinnatiensis]MCG3727975.1 transcriptional regulator [Vibrio cincinnatiensis]
MSKFDTKFILANRFTFDPMSNLLIDTDAGDEEIRLGSNESRILFMLVQRPNDVITRNELHNYVWREQGFEVDDSSLTQAISTLRKMLKDSTKAPQFIKTVPKRGYQLIANVESIESEDSKETSGEVAPLDEPTTTSIFVSEPEPVHENSDVESKTDTTKYHFDIAAKILLVCALILPLMAFLLTVPPASKFRRLAVMDQVAISTPINHPDLSSWLPLIETCVKKYRAVRGEEIFLNLKEVIATGGESNQLMLNYIHTPRFSGENITLRIFANANNTEKVCQ